MQLSKEQMKKVAACKDSSELMTLAKTQGIELTKDDADKYFAQLSGQSLSMDDIEKVAGGCFTNVCAGDVCANLC